MDLDTNNLVADIVHAILPYITFREQKEELRLRDMLDDLRAASSDQFTPDTPGPADGEATAPSAAPVEDAPAATAPVADSDPANPGPEPDASPVSTPDPVSAFPVTVDDTDTGKHAANV